MDWHAVTLASILAIRSWTIWNEAIGLPNCLRSCVYLSACLERAHLEPGRHPADPVPGQTQHARGVAERIATLQAVRFRHPAVVQGDLAVLDHLEGHLVLDLLDAEAGRRLVLDDEALDLVVVDDRAPR